MAWWGGGQIAIKLHHVLTPAETRAPSINRANTECHLPRPALQSSSPTTFRRRLRLLPQSRLGVEESNNAKCHRRRLTYAGEKTPQPSVPMPPWTATAFRLTPVRERLAGSFETAFRSGRSEKRFIPEREPARTGRWRQRRGAPSRARIKNNMMLRLIKYKVGYGSRPERAANGGWIQKSKTK